MKVSINEGMKSVDYKFLYVCIVRFRIHVAGVSVTDRISTGPLW